MKEVGSIFSKGFQSIFSKEEYEVGTNWYGLLLAEMKCAKNRHNPVNLLKISVTDFN
jgi:hypothetical protein